MECVFLKLLLKHFTRIKLFLFSKNHLLWSWGLHRSKGDLDRTYKKGKLKTVSIKQGAMYTILPHAKSRDNLSLCLLNQNVLK